MEIADPNQRLLKEELACPEKTRNGRQMPGYALFREIAEGDLILHYDARREIQAIVEWSRVLGTPQEGQVDWPPWQVDKRLAVSGSGFP